MTPSSLTPWLSELVAHPGDGFVYGLFADWLEYPGSPDVPSEPGMASGMRWAARERKWPICNGTLGGWWPYFGGTDTQFLPTVLVTNQTLESVGRTDAELAACWLAFLERCREVAWDEAGNPL